MRYMMILLMLVTTHNSFAQKKNSIIIKGFLFDIDGRYKYKEYFGKVSTLRDFSLSYYRVLGASGKWYVGGGAGYRKGYINEFNPDSLKNENAIFTTPVTNLMIRMEEWIGRRSKFVIDLGLSFSWDGKIKTVNSLGNTGHPNMLRNSKSIIGTLGYQNKFFDNWNIIAGLSTLYGLDHALLHNGRDVKLVNTTFFTGLRRDF